MNMLKTEKNHMFPKGPTEIFLEVIRKANKFAKKMCVDETLDH